MKIGIFGGSFNPVHSGHILAANTFINEVGLDYLYIIPAGIPPHKQMAGGCDDLDRLNMAEIAFRDLGEKTEVSACELNRGAVSYTIDTVIEFSELSPNDDIYLYIGDDMFLCFDTWKDYDKIFSLCTLFVMKRNKNTTGLIEKANYFREKFNANIIISDSEPIEISSSEIRMALASGENPEELSPEVYAYIRRNGLYGTDILKNIAKAEDYIKTNISEKRAAHIFAVKDEVKSLISIFHLEAYDNKLILAALLHDITKELNLKEHLKLCEDCDIMLNNDDFSCPETIHSKSAAAVAKCQYGLEKEFCDAIYFHTTARANMTIFDKILYFSDCIEKTRTIPSCIESRGKFYSSLTNSNVLNLKLLDNVIMFSLEKTVEYLSNNNMKIHRETRKAIEYLKNKETGRE